MCKKILIGVFLLGIMLNAAKLDLAKDTYITNENIVVNFSDMKGKNKDWIAIYPSDSTNDWSNVLLWKWTNDVVKNSLTFKSLPIGDYEVRAFYNNSFKLETSKRFRVREDNTPNLTKISTDKSVYSVGEDVVSTFTNLSGSEQDWIAVYPKGTNNDWSNVLQWHWSQGEVEGRRIFKSLAKGDYEVRVFFNNTYNLEATHSFTIADNHDITTVKAGKKTYSTTENISVTFNNVVANEENWMAIYPKGTNNDWGNVVQWTWIKNKNTGNYTFDSLARGDYEVRLFFNNTYKLEASFSFSVTNDSIIADRKDFQLFGDTEFNRIVGMQLSTMKQVVDQPLNGELIYSADIINAEKSYAYGRGTNKIFILKYNNEGNFLKEGSIDLPFAPRTGAKNRKFGLTLITGSQKPMYALINTRNDKVVATGGRNEVTSHDTSNHGSNWATGHGIWLTDRHFVVPDREARELILYKINPNGFKVTELSRMKTSSSVHTVIGGLNNETGIYYAVTEGSDESRASLVEFRLVTDKIYKKRIVKMRGENLAEIDAHHAKALPDGIHIYMGAGNGYLHVINKRTMKIVKRIKAGKGAGHTTLVPSRNLALVTNHNDTFVTVINTKTHRKVKDVIVSGASIKGTALQSHTARISPDSKYYYNFATDNGYYYRINLDTLSVDKKTYTGGTPKQASQPGEVKY